ncbi:hypothetical protein BJ742DRAFT_68218 [Cladochytrium replicatum]|nr:hypothetical protein BJ742DRAFT_68218 [Cladochytrium replicatum]
MYHNLLLTHLLLAARSEGSLTLVHPNRAKALRNLDLCVNALICILNYRINTLYLRTNGQHTLERGAHYLPLWLYLEGRCILSGNLS